MPTIVVCGCGKRLEAPDSLAGKRVKCPHCGQPLSIPELPGQSIPSGGDPFAAFGGGSVSGGPGWGGFGGGSSPYLSPPTVPAPAASGGKPQTLVLLAVGGVVLLLAGLGAVWYFGSSEPAPIAARQTPSRPAGQQTVPARLPLQGTPPAKQPPAPVRTTRPQIVSEERIVILARRAKKMREVVSGLLIFADNNLDRFPINICAADGKPLMSWRVELLPALGHEALYLQLRMDEPWNSPHNAAVLAQVPPRLFASQGDTPDGHADILAVVGSPDFGFLPNSFRTGGVRISEFASFTSYTAFAVEVSPERSVPWAEPADYRWNPTQPTAGLGPEGSDTFLAICGDTRVLEIPRTESAASLGKFFCRNEGAGSVPASAKSVPGLKALLPQSRPPSAP